MKFIGFLFLLFISVFDSFSQSIIEWTPDVQLQLSDFRSPQTEVNKELTSYSIYSGSNLDFSFQMSSYEFMFTKNFNSKAKTVFNQNASVIMARDSTMAQQLVNFGQYSFDLTELYTRKFRKQMYENKGTFSDVNFFQSIFSELQSEMNQENARVLKLTDLGRNGDILVQEHQKVLAAIDLLADFCKDCKPPKRKKKKK